jgi:hypothetical protein
MCTMVLNLAVLWAVSCPSSHIICNWLHEQPKGCNQDQFHVGWNKQLYGHKRESLKKCDKIQ